MIVFADTSALFALLVSDDFMHIRAKKIFAYFAENGVQLVSSSYVLLETLALLQRRIGLNAVNDFNLRILPLLNVIWVDFDWHSRVMQRLVNQNQRDVSLVDCLSFEIMQAQGIVEAYTFDKHFEENGFVISAYHEEGI